MSESREASRLPLVDLRRQHESLQPELDATIARVFESSDFILGKEAREFENEFASFLGVEHAVACGNGTDALELALWAVGVKPGDEVITVAHTFAATAEAIIRAGATPRFVDISPDTLLMDLDQVERGITPRTSAIVPVHIYGSCVDMDALMALARTRGLKVVEDAAQAHGALVNGRSAGTAGDAGTFSFYPGKNLGACGDAGAVVTRDAKTADLIARARNHGRSGKYTHSFVGRNSRMDGLQAAILRLKLGHLAAWNARRRAIAARYRFLLEDLPEVHAIEPHDGEPIYHLFVVECEDRDAVRERMGAAGIATGIHYPVPLHLQVAFAGPDQPKEGELPVTERAAVRILSLPMFPEMTDGEADRVVTALTEAVRQVRTAPSERLRD